MSEERRPLPQSLRETWLSVLGLLTGAEASVSKAAQRLIESVEGEAAHTREAVRELFERVKKNREAFEARVEEGVKTAVARVHKPIAQEMESLRGRVEVLQRRVEELSRRRRKRGDGGVPRDGG